jgi:general secretion pathway protein G
VKHHAGFTLIEMVVVLAVVAILAAILVPTIANNINDAKLARAKNETQVIGGAVASFYKDLGRWPTANGAAAALADSLTLLYGNSGAVPTSGGATTANWVQTGLAATARDTFENQLIGNTPGGQAVNVYAVRAVGGEIGWNGPYIGQLNSDPWGGYYACNILNSYTAGVGAWVMSFGPNRTANTIFAVTSATTSPTSDDIGTRLK